MPSKPILVTNFLGGLNTSEPTTIEDNQLQVARNVYYNNQKILESANGFEGFGVAIDGVDNIHSIYFTKLIDGSRILLAGAGEDLYRYNEETSEWDSIQDGLTPNLKMSFTTFKNVIYITNGVDDYMSYDGTDVTTHETDAENGVALKGKYLIVANDVGFLAGVTAGAGDAQTIFYTNPNPDNLLTFPNNIPINEDDGREVTALAALGPTVFVGKEDSGIYTLDVTGELPTVRREDYSGGVVSHRAWVNVENDLYLLSNNGVYTLAQRRGTTGSYRAFPISRFIYDLIARVENKSSAVGYYYSEKNNYYLAVDTENAGRNRGLLVWSVLTNSWTEYKGVNINDFTLYEDEFGVKRLLGANAFGGQVVELERGYTHNNENLESVIKTKQFDFGTPETHKNFTMVEIIGAMSRQTELEVCIEVDGEKVFRTVDGSDFVIDGGAAGPLGEGELGEGELGGGVAGEALPINNFNIRIYPYKLGRTISVQIRAEGRYFRFQWQKLSLQVEGEPIDLIPASNIY